MTRQGKTIIEVLVVISVFGAMMTPIGRLMHAMMRSEREGAHALAASTSRSRLAREFRSDVHAARDVELAADENGDLRLIQEDGRVVTYRSGQDGVHRIANRDEETVSRDSFRLPDGTTRFEVSDAPPLVVLLHERHSPSAHSQEGPGISVLRVEAVPGRDHRFAK